jgi:hypothetical protein
LDLLLTPARRQLLRLFLRLASLSLQRPLPLAFGAAREAAIAAMAQVEGPDSSAHVDAAAPPPPPPLPLTMPRARLLLPLQLMSRAPAETVSSVLRVPAPAAAPEAGALDLLVRVAPAARSAAAAALAAGGGTGEATLTLPDDATLLRAWTVWPSQVYRWALAQAPPPPAAVSRAFAVAAELASVLPEGPGAAAEDADGEDTRVLQPLWAAARADGGASEAHVVSVVTRLLRMLQAMHGQLLHLPVTSARAAFAPVGADGALGSSSTGGRSGGWLVPREAAKLADTTKVLVCLTELRELV